MIIKSMKEQKDSKSSVPFVPKSAYAKTQEVFRLSIQQQIKAISKILNNVQSTIQDLKINSQVVNSEFLKQSLNNLPNFRELAKRSQELFNALHLGSTDLRSFSELSTELKKNENYFDTNKLKVNNSIDNKFMHSMSEYFRSSLLETQNDDSKIQNFSSISQFEDPLKKHEIDLQNYKIQGQKNYHQIQQFPMKVKLENDHDLEEQNSASTLFQYMNTQSEILSYNNSLPSQGDLPAFSTKCSEMQIDNINIHSDFDDDPLINMKKYKISNVKNEEDWDKADNTLTNIKQILCNFPQDETENSQKQVNPELFEKVKSKYSIECSENLYSKINEDIDKQMIKQVSGQSKDISNSHQEFDTTEEKSSRKSHPFVYEVPLSMNYYIPQCKLCPQIYTLTFGFETVNQNDSQDFGDLMQSKKTENENFGYSQSMLEHVSLKTGAPVYLLNDNSSQGNRTDRSMYVQQKLNLVFNENINTVKEIHDPVVQVSQFYDMRQKLLHIEQEKNEVFEQLRRADKEIKSLRQELYVNKQIIDKLECGNKDQFKELKQMVLVYQKRAQQLESELQIREQHIVKLEEINQGLIEERHYLDSVVKDKEYEIDSYKHSIEEIKHNFEMQIEKITAQNNEKHTMIRQLQRQLYDSRYDLRSQIFELAKVNDELRSQMDELNRDIDGKRTEIQKLNMNHSQIMSTLQKTCRQDEYLYDMEQLSTFQKVYSQEFTKIKEDYDVQLLSRKNSIVDLQRQNNILKESTNLYKQKQQQYRQSLKQYQQSISKLQQEVRRHEEENKKGKLVLSSQVQEEINYLRRQLVNANKEVQIKDIRVKELLVQMRKIKVEESANVSVEFVGTQEQSAYILQLKQVVQDYEKIIQSHHKVIRELQESAYEFLEDALSKEHELEKVEQENFSLKKDLRTTVSERLTLLKENARMKKMLSNSQKKISAIGSKLTSYVYRDDESSATFDRKKLHNENQRDTRDSTLKIGEKY